MSLVKEAGLETLHTRLGCKLAQASSILTASLNRVERLAPTAFTMRTEAIAAFKAKRPAWAPKFAELQEIESDLTTFLQPASQDLKDLQKDALGQLSFQDETFRQFNFVPFVLLGLSLFKIWAVPLMTILTPLLAWVLPYIFLKFMYHLPISSEQYTGILQMLWSGSMPKFTPGPDGRPVIQAPSLYTPRSLIQAVLFGVSFLQGMIQPIQNAYHLYKTDRTIYANGQKVLRLYALYKEFTTETEAMGLHLKFRESLDDIDLDDPRRTVHLLIEQPERLRIAFRDLADVEILWRIAMSPDLQPAEVIENGPYPYFQAKGLYDISLPAGKTVPSDVGFTGMTSHAALTGPNGGGKSSFLRGFLQCILLAQAYGVAPAERVLLRRFGWISSGLRLQDAPGSMSMFETEVWFAASLLGRQSSKGPGLVLYDELFHSTNPPDGIETARIFLGRLWERRDVLSIVSTHVFDLVEKAPANVQRLACQASLGSDGRLQYGYAVETGICRLSSVKSIWERFGLLGSSAVRSQANPENLVAEKK